MRIIQSRIFEQKVKKLSSSDKTELDNAVREVIARPDIGEQKKGDLRTVLVYKFRIQIILYLMAYRYNTDTLELLMLGTHENYYKELKNYLKNR
ncbi:MAG: type II toxin-antitoxin system RelE/ParE family toxin [Bacteroidales bacterium]|nr:type II toxin-antitoxin system RelE/ParE family toxin [Bacteroidales bacterium]